MSSIFILMKENIFSWDMQINKEVQLWIFWLEVARCFMSDESKQTLEMNPRYLWMKTIRIVTADWGKSIQRRVKMQDKQCYIMYSLYWRYDKQSSREISPG